MGALSSNRKRGDDYFKTHSFSTPFDQSYGHISKKPKLSVPVTQTTPETNRVASSNSIVSIIAQYPDRKSGFSRGVIAPVRNWRFESSISAKSFETIVSSRETTVAKMGAFSFFSQRLRRSKEFVLRFSKCMDTRKQEGNEVIELSSEDEGRDDISSDSRIEELEIVGSVGRSKAGHEAVENFQQPNAKKTDKEVMSLDSSVVTDVSNDDPDVPLYMRLHDSSKKRDNKLANINFDIELHEKRFQGFHLLRPPKVEEPMKKDVAEECFVPLTDEEKKEISRAFSNSNRRRILISHRNSCIDITGEKLQCLKPGAWLNDEVINLYFELLKEREKREPQKFLKCHFFNTFFYKKLISGRGGYNFQSLRRWTSQKKLGYSLLDCDKIFVPIHKEIHWCLAVINKKDEKFQYLDSLGGFDDQVLNALAKYFVDEVKDKCGKDIFVGSWKKEFVTELPEQLNGFDCGMFMIKYADFYSRNIGLKFSQDDMPYFRQRTAKEILKLRAD